ncbi:MAG TPA: hypothetical protein VEX38_10350, partial [Fimbriimonadaceae bacterium]|nr:hypothetical protein [Fimbriimonadaceae bacterium]
SKLATMRLARSLAILLVLLATAAIASQGITFKRAPKQGDTVKYRIEMAFQMWGEDVTYRSLLTEKVSLVEDNGNFMIETLQSEYKAAFGEEEVEVPAKDVPPTATVYGPTGSIVQVRGSLTNDAVYRMSNLGAVRFPDSPVALGGTWTSKVAADPKTGVQEAVANYTLEGEEKIGEWECYRVKFDYKENAGSDPASAEGTVWIGKTDSIVAKYQAEWKNAPVSGLPNPITVRVSYTREP